ncbi:L-lysine exporter family protein LysE/ArgO [Marinospirillum celere]|uniref:L-lysine exporter family protein LysE/ArgO n=1 Tax=Marinospirillum celere TaxID=1122252 RepID=A0A1I1JAC9_9GAMM|nr:LysE family transporter [Marinospirillum celere]SFC45559.1 L-lysine exporter family protein LysE/ArgO [Marinospirillum celere]
MLVSFFTGFGIALGLIVAIGAQNAWVLNKSMRGEHPWIIAGVCCSLDALLITLGVYSIDTLQALIPGLVPIMTWLGVALLCWLAVQAFWRAWQGTGGLVVQGSAVTTTGWQVAGQAMAISLLNPHVYLDTLVLIGSVGAQQAYAQVFVVGAALASAVWFFSLAFFGGYLGPKLQSVRAWRIFDTLIGSIMLLVAISLLPQ